MKRVANILALAALIAGLSGCSSAWYRAESGSNAWSDLYVVHDRTAIAQEQKAKAEARKAEAEARQAEWEALLAEARARNAEEAYYDADEGFGGILADDYESAYARRLRGFESETYRLPASYFELQYNSPTVYYLSAYDPAYYNVIVMGDQVWVEPKYITSMFGSWGGGLTVYNGGWYFGFGVAPSYAWWGYPHYSWWDWGWAYYNPWYGPWYNPWWYGPGWWGPCCPPHHGGWWGPHAPARPHNYRLAGGGSASRYRPGTTSTGTRYRPGGAAGRYGSGTVSRGSGIGSGRTYYQSGGRTNSSSRVYDRGSSTVGSSNRNTYTPQRNNNTYTPPRNNNNNSYSPGRTSSFGSGSFGSGGGSRGVSSGGGSRGGSSSGGSRGFGGR